MNFHTINREKGRSFWGVISGIALLAWICYILVAAIPHYLNDQKLHSALVKLADKPEAMTLHRTSLLHLLKHELDTEYPDFGFANLNFLDDAFDVEFVGGKREFSIDYEVAVPVFYGISMLIDFENQVSVPN